MANSHNLFQEYHQEISISSKKNEKMKNSKEALRKRIKAWFEKNHPDYKPCFYIQGSYKMKNGIRTSQDICDLDDGIYFFRQPDVSASTLKDWVKQAVDGHTDTKPENRKKCVRSIFVNDYEIDHPVYYKVEGQEYKLAVNGSGFEDSNPKAVVDWFVSNKDKEGRLVRIIKYLKGWADKQTFKMPSGLALTILATNAKNRIVLNERDDISLRDILKEIKRDLTNKFECIVPAVPKDDLLDSYVNKDKFLDCLDRFIEDADRALFESNHRESSKAWRKHLGDRFPLGQNKEENRSLSSAAAALGAITSKPFGV
ncbi:CBASS cGAMP synthase [Myroides odoratimimus]|uniref:CBASS cGAMP synthase n=1 Tax=Myroides odoratimimus TaxID=76832 RepID=UPI002DBD53C6|nr:CBASS cGAMP synthase [Myroides odoratimimus]MEC4076170.1 CBASS cGAMP synthase [Myroides odoratimimus]